MPCGGKRQRCGFTLVEVLAALVFMAIVIPVAVEALRISSRAGELSYRKSAAARVADRVLNENLITSGAKGLSQSGVAIDGTQQFRWTIRSEPWTQDAMTMVTVQVSFPVQGREYEVHMSTLVSNTAGQ